MLIWVAGVIIVINHLIQLLDRIGLLGGRWRGGRTGWEGVRHALGKKQLLVLDGRNPILLQLLGFFKAFLGNLRVVVIFSAGLKQIEAKKP